MLFEYKIIQIIEQDANIKFSNSQKINEVV